MLYKSDSTKSSDINSVFIFLFENAKAIKVLEISLKIRGPLTHGLI